MSISLTFKSYKSKDNRQPLIFRVQYNGAQFEKSTGIKVKKEHFNKTLLRVSSEVPSHLIYNKRLEALKTLVFDSYDLLESGAYTFEEFKYRVNSENNSLDVITFLDNVYKNSKSEVTYSNYKSVLENYRKTLGYKQLTFTDFEYANVSKFIRLCQEKNLSGASINTYITHIKAVYNEAYNRGLVSTPFRMHKTYRQRRVHRIAVTATPEDVEAGIEKCANIRDVQAIAMYLLMFSMRGLYLKDLMTMYKHVLTNPAGETRHVIHKRSKTGEPMQILYSCEPTEGLISLLQHSFHYTHREELRPARNSSLELLKYNVQDHKLHNNLMDVYKKRSTKLIGKSFKTARKTFESYAMLLDVSSSIRYKLLGHVDNTIKRHYLNWEWEKLVDKVDEAHTRVLREFRAPELYRQLLSKARSLELPEDLYNEEVYLAP